LAAFSRACDKIGNYTWVARAAGRKCGSMVMGMEVYNEYRAICAMTTRRWMMGRQDCIARQKGQKWGNWHFAQDLVTTPPLFVSVPARPLTRILLSSLQFTKWGGM
jgi:hypothetical protein